MHTETSIIDSARIVAANAAAALVQPFRDWAEFAQRHTEYSRLRFS